MRSLSRGLVALEVDGAGLTPALEALAARVHETSAIACSFVSVGTFPLSDATVASHLLRIAQEAVANALRHADAKRITVSLTVTEHATELRVRDDGHGFAPTAAEVQGGVGLKLMRYRAGLIGATLAIESSPTGTAVSCSLPVGQRHGTATAVAP